MLLPWTLGCKHCREAVSYKEVGIKDREVYGGWELPQKHNITKYCWTSAWSCCIHSWWEEESLEQWCYPKNASANISCATELLEADSEDREVYVA